MDADGDGDGYLQGKAEVDADTGRRRVCGTNTFGGNRTASRPERRSGQSAKPLRQSALVPSSSRRAPQDETPCLITSRHPPAHNSDSTQPRGKEHAVFELQGLLESSAIWNRLPIRIIAEIGMSSIASSMLRFPARAITQSSATRLAAPNRKIPKLHRGQTAKLLRQDKVEEAPQARDLRQKDVYEPPTKGFISCLPDSWIPYADLARLDQPTGTIYVFLPCLFSTMLAGSMITPVASTEHCVATIALFLAGAFVMRGAGCTINDIWDRNLDPHVERTKFRPIARRAVTPVQATAFLGTQLLAGLGILLQFPTSCLYYAIPSLLLVGTYPLAKRVTNYPQFVLGLVFSWGAIMGFPAMGIDLLSDTNTLCTAAALYASCVAWTVNYDMVYAHMDIKDDVRAGIKSIALAHEHNTKALMQGLGVAQVVPLAASEYFAGFPWSLMLMHGVFIQYTLDSMRKRVDLKSIASCLDYWKRCAGAVGGAITFGLLSNYLIQTAKQRPAEESEPPLLEKNPAQSAAEGPPV